MKSLVAHLCVFLVFLPLWGEDWWNDEILRGLLHWWLLRLLLGLFVLVDGPQELDLSALLAAGLLFAPALKQMNGFPRFLCSKRKVSERK